MVMVPPYFPPRISQFEEVGFGEALVCAQYETNRVCSNSANTSLLVLLSCVFLSAAKSEFSTGSKPTRIASSTDHL